MLQIQTTEKKRKEKEKHILEALCKPSNVSCINTEICPQKDAKQQNEFLHRSTSLKKLQMILISSYNYMPSYSI